MIAQFPALIIILPLLAALVIVIAGWLNEKYCFPLAVSALGASFLAAIAVLYRVITSGIISYRLAGWPPP